MSQASTGSRSNRSKGSKKKKGSGRKPPNDFAGSFGSGPIAKPTKAKTAPVGKIIELKYLFVCIEHVI